MGPRRLVRPFFNFLSNPSLVVEAERLRELPRYLRGKTRRVHPQRADVALLALRGWGVVLKCE